MATRKQKKQITLGIAIGSAVLATFVPIVIAVLRPGEIQIDSFPMGVGTIAFLAAFIIAFVFLTEKR
jgi:hypothetical protein